jgi:hypothetical protein
MIRLSRGGSDAHVLREFDAQKREFVTGGFSIADRRGLPVAVHIESATPHEVTLVHATLVQRFVKPFPVRLIGGQRLRVGPPGC